MFEEFTIKNFRCFRFFTLEDLGRVNLIGGMNNAGKTSLLEALFIHLGSNIPELPLRVNIFRGIQQFKPDAEAIWGWLFFEKRTNQKIELISNENNLIRSLEIKLADPEFSSFVADDRSESEPLRASSSLTTKSGLRELVLEYQEDGQKYESSILIRPDGFIGKRHQFISSKIGIFITASLRSTGEDAERFSKVERFNRQDEVLKTLQILEPRLKRLAVLIEGGIPIIAGDIGIGELVPMPFMGEGMVRLLSIVLAISNAPNGIVLIDEVETGLHHSVLVKVWSAIADIAQNSNTQIFATTHSLECIRAAHQAFTSRNKYDFRYHRLERVKDDIKAVTYDQETINTAVEMNFELR